MESLSDIVSDIRNRADCAERHGDRETHNDGVATLLRSIADRIEAIDSADAWRSLYTPGNAAAMRDALNKVGNAAAWIAESCNDQQTAKYMNDMIAIVQTALSAPARNQEVLAAPIDLNERFIHIGDSVHMLNTGHDGDHEWDDVVLSLEYVGKSGGDNWLVHGEDGAAWACECEVLNGR